jgi:hypothetical protein
MGKSYKTGKATIEIPEDMTKMFLDVLKRVVPNAEKIMDEEMARIEMEAKKDWPRRQPIIRKDNEGKISFYRDPSKKSFQMFRRGVRISPSGDIIVYLKNTAPYSWAIKFGEDSKNKDGDEILQPQGRRVATELMVKPLTKSSRKVVKALSRDLGKRI